MIGKAERLPIKEAQELGMVEKIVPSIPELIDAAIAEVNRLQGNLPEIIRGPVSIPPFVIPETPMAGELRLSRQALGIIARVINQAAAAGSLQEALEISYLGAGEMSCIKASKEGVNAFLQKRRPDFVD